MTPRIGAIVTLRSGERCVVQRVEFTEKGLALWMLKCAGVAGDPRRWTGLLGLTTRELRANVA